MRHGIQLRAWQAAALEKWQSQNMRGIVSVVTGGGKTVFALSCIAASKIDTALIVVPTLPLLDQWWEEAAAFFSLRLDDINVINARGKMKSGTVNIAVINTAAKLAQSGRALPSMLVVDECHKAASDKFRNALDVPSKASLGLSATPERQYDDGLNEILVPALGPVFFEYTYADALKDSVIVPFRLQNVVFDLEPERQNEYNNLTRAIGRSMSGGQPTDRSIALMLKRSRLLNLSPSRVRIALRIVAAHKNSKILIFHEDIEACDVIHYALRELGIASGIYHSKQTLRERAETLMAYREGRFSVLVTCRALDEGFNVPETQVGIIAASTATRRQRIQRLGRVLRPAEGKNGALIYSLVASGPEIARLKAEEKDLLGVATVAWSRA